MYRLLILLTFSSNEMMPYFPFSSFWTHVLPSLREKHDEFMLKEPMKRWANHKIVVRWLSRFFPICIETLLLSSLREKHDDLLP